MGGNLRRGQEDGALRVNVTDNGIGIAKGIRGRSSSASSRPETHRPTSQKEPGSVFPSSREILQQFDGEIWVESEIGKGATVSFRCHRRTRDRDGSSKRRSRTQTGLKYNSGERRPAGWQDNLVETSASCARRKYFCLQDGALVNDGPQAAHQMLLFAFAEARFRHKITDLAAGFQNPRSVGGATGGR